MHVSENVFPVIVMSEQPVQFVHVSVHKFGAVLREEKNGVNSVEGMKPEEGVVLEEGVKP